MSYLPKFAFSKTTEQYISENYEASFLEDIISHDVKYKYIIQVYRKGEDQPFLAITSERFNPQASLEALGFDEDMIDPEMLTTETYFLCGFINGTHKNFGNDHDWSHEYNFKNAALDLIAQILEEEFMVNLKGIHPIVFSQREKNILFFIKEGLARREIAEKMMLAPRSVETFFRNIMAKLRIKSLGNLRRVAQELNEGDI